MDANGLRRECQAVIDYLMTHPFAGWGGYFGNDHVILILRQNAKGDSLPGASKDDITEILQGFKKRNPGQFRKVPGS